MRFSLTIEGSLTLDDLELLCQNFLEIRRDFADLEQQWLSE